MNLMWHLLAPIGNKDRSRGGACTEGSLRSLLVSKSHESDRNRVSGVLKSQQPSAVALLAGLEAIGALLRTERSSPGVVPDKTKLSLADGAALCCVTPEILGTVAHFHLLPPMGFAWVMPDDHLSSAGAFQ
jgi:hypothetical protein